MTSLFLPLCTLAGALLIGAMSPGPAFLFVVQASVAGSRREGLAAALGMGGGAVFYAVLVLVGLQALLAELAGAFLVLKTIGGCYLIYLAVGLWRGAGRALPESGASAVVGRSVGRVFRRALFTQLGNPKVLVVYGSVIAAVMPPDLPRGVALGVLVMVLVIETSWYAVVALALSAAAPRRAYLRGKSVFDRIAGSVMGLLGVRLLLMPVETR